MSQNIFTLRNFNRLIKHKKQRRKLLDRLLRFPTASLNYHLGNYEEKIWLVGDGRSGTTWLSDLINWHKGYRELFEPIHPGHVQQASSFGFYPYLRPDDDGSSIGKFLYRVFDGEFKHYRADVSHPRIVYQGLLVKDIFAHLLVGWVHHHIPEAKKVMIIRNPFSVAVSKMKYSNWLWMTEAKAFLNQRPLTEDFLLPFEDLIKQSGTGFVENQILIWAIIHYVFLKGMNPKDVYILFYENLFSNPEEEISSLFSHLYQEHHKGLEKGLLDLIKKPTRTQGFKFSSLNSKSPLHSWKDNLNKQQIDHGMKILECFGLDEIYRGSSFSAINAVSNLDLFHSSY